MKRAVRYAILGAAVAAALAFLTPPTAQAQVRFEGRFRLPHGEIAVGVGDPYPVYGSPYFPVGSYVPYGYRVVRRPRLGYGVYSPEFSCRTHHAYHAHWVPVRPYRTRYVVVERPVYVGGPVYVDGYYRGDRYRDRYHDRRYDRRYDDRYSDDPYYDREYWDRSYDPYDR
jgi:hypothetical protein